MFMTKHSRVNVLVKFLLSYVLAFILPMILIFTYFYPRTTEAVMEQTMDSSLHVTEQIKSSMDIQFDNIYKIPVELFNNRNLKKYALEQDDYNKYIAIEEMGKYISTNKFVYDAFLYIRDTGTLYSNRNTFPISSFRLPGSEYHYDSWSYDDLVSTVNNLKKPLVRPSESVTIPDGHHKRLITFLYPLPIGNSNPYATVLILVDENTVRSLVKSVSMRSNSNILILDNNDRIIQAFNDAPYLKSGDFGSLLSGFSGSSSFTASMNGQEYLISYTTSGRNDWKYVSIIPMKDVMGKLDSVKRLTVLLLLLIALVEGLLIYISIRTNYKPIRSLVEFARQCLAQDSPEKRMNEFEVIRYAIDDLNLRNNRLNEHVRCSRSAVREYFLYGLLNGQYDSIEKFNEDAGEYGLFFKQNYFTVSLIRILKCGSGLGREHWLKYFEDCENNMPDSIEGYFISGIYKDNILFLSAQNSIGDLVAYLGELRAELENVQCAVTVIGIGNPVHSVSATNVSYQQARIAAESLVVKRNADILLFSDLPSKTLDTKNQLPDRISLLEFAILRNDLEQIREIIDKIIEHINRAETPAHAIRSIYSSVVSIMDNGYAKLTHGSREGLSPAVHDPDILSVEEITKSIRQKADALCGCIAKSTAVSKDVSIREILHYIETHYTNYDFSLQTVAEYYNMTFSNFSHYFKNNTNQNFKDYVEFLRVKKAKELLGGTNSPLEEIARDIGYSNASNFVRAFKKSAGLTPGEYRNASRLAFKI
jgi:AraC-like DNA-binding protein